MSSSTLLLLFLAEGAALGVALAVACPGFGPQRLTSAVVAFGAALGGLFLLPGVIGALAAYQPLLRATIGLLFAPVFAGVFWTSACLLRTLVRELGPVVSRL